MYDFRCPKCGHRFEVLTSIEKRDSVVCEKCGSPVERVYQGKCAFGAVKGGCSGNCACCGGCGGSEQ